MGQRIRIGNPDSGFRQAWIVPKKGKNNFMFEEFSVGLEASHEAWMYFVVTVFDLKQMIVITKNLGLDPDPDSVTSNPKHCTTHYLTEGRKKNDWEFWKGFYILKQAKERTISWTLVLSTDSPSSRWILVREDCRSASRCRCSS
jgi:hypothetical protein